MAIVFMFPGQSSRYPTMLSKLKTDIAHSTIENASDILRFEVRSHFSPDNPNLFNCNWDVQIGVFLANHITACELHEREIIPNISLGLSLGEYNHLVQIEALTFESGLRLVAARGRAYDRGPDGLMAAVGPINLDELRRAIDDAGVSAQVEVSNLNSPKHHVIAGARKGVERVLSHLSEEYFIDGVLIEHRIPMHTRLFQDVSHDFGPALEEVDWRIPTKPYVPNVLGRVHHHPSRAEIIWSLRQHVFRPVLWRQSIEAVCERYPNSIIVEAGPRSILYNLLSQSWIPNRKVMVDSDVDNAPDYDGIAKQIRAMTDA